MRGWIKICYRPNLEAEFWLICGTQLQGGRAAQPDSSMKQQRFNYLTGSHIHCGKHICSLLSRFRVLFLHNFRPDFCHFTFPRWTRSAALETCGALNLFLQPVTLWTRIAQQLFQYSPICAAASRLFSCKMQELVQAVRVKFPIIEMSEHFWIHLCIYSFVRFLMTLWENSCLFCCLSNTGSLRSPPVFLFLSCFQVRLTNRAGKP